MEPADVNTMNEHMVGVQGDFIVFLNPPAKITKERAIVLAAWILTLADDNDEFGIVIEAVQK